MALQFNNPSPDYGFARKQFEPNTFYGRKIDKMPELLKDNRLPLSVAGFMKLRLKALDLYSAVLENPSHFTRQYRREISKFFNDVWNNYVDSGDAVLYHPDGNIKLDLDSATLRQINSNSNIPIGAILLESGSYAAINMPEFTREEAEKYTGKPQTANETLNNRFWRVLARHPDEVPTDFADDPLLLKNYVIAENKLAEIAYGYTENMGVYVSGKPSQERMRLWSARNLGARSDANGNYHLGVDLGRIVGVAPEVPQLTVPPTERLEQIVATLSKHSSDLRPQLLLGAL